MFVKHSIEEKKAILICMSSDDQVTPVALEEIASKQFETKDLGKLLISSDWSWLAQENKSLSQRNTF